MNTPGSTVSYETQCDSFFRSRVRKGPSTCTTATAGCQREGYQGGYLWLPLEIRCCWPADDELLSGLGFESDHRRMEGLRSYKRANLARADATASSANRRKPGLGRNYAPRTYQNYTGHADGKHAATHSGSCWIWGVQKRHQ